MGNDRAWFGRIFTGRHYAEALLVSDGRVVAVGHRAEVERIAPTGTERVELGSHLVIPGLIDNHVHLFETAEARHGASLRGVRSIDELVDRLREQAERRPDQPVSATGWDDTQLRDGRWPTRADLDRAVTDRPAVAWRVCRHAAVANSALLESLGIDASTPDPEGGRIGRDASGVPDGRLYDRALDALSTVLAPIDRVEPAAVSAVLQEAASYGLTTVVAMQAEPEEVEAARWLVSGGDSPVRLRAYLRADRLGDAGPLLRRPMPADLQVAGAKIVADGTLGARTAWLAEPYADSPEESGLALASVEAMGDQMAEVQQAGLQLAVHAIGDQALFRVLTLLTFQPGQKTTRIEHASLTPPSLVFRMDRLRPYVVVQPGFTRSDSWLVDRLGPSRARWAYAYRTLWERGHVLAGSSDSPTEPLDPWVGIRAATDRPVPPELGEEGDERLTDEDAITLYTRHGGQVLGEPTLGVLEPGAAADLVILRANHLPDAIALGSTVVQETWRDGRPVYAAGAGRRG